MSEVPSPYVINIELFWPDGTRPNQNQIARVRALDVNGPVITDEGQSGFNAGTGGWMPVIMQNIAAFFPPRTRPNLRLQVESTQEQVVHVTQIFNAIPSGSTVKIIIGVSDELVGGGSGGGNFRVFGQVRGPDGSLVTTGTVRAYDVTNGSDALLGTATLGSSGAYSITYTAAAFNQNGSPHTQPNLQVRAYDASGMFLAQSERRANAGADELMNLMVSEIPQPTLRRVFGTITNRLGLVVSGIKVEAKHLAWTSTGIQEITLGLGATSSDTGDYSIPYDLPVVSSPSAECGTPASQINLLVLAEDATDSSVLTRSPLIFDAPAEQRVDLTVDRVSTSDDSEYKRLHERISPCLGTGDALWLTLNTLATRPDFLDFAAQASGEPLPLVQAYVQAWLIAGEIHAKAEAAPLAPLFKLKLDTGVSPEVMFGLVRNGLGSTLRQLLDVTPDSFFDATVNAIHGGFISASIEPLLLPTSDVSADSLLDDWRTVLGRLLANASLDGGPIWQQELIKLVFAGNDPATQTKRQKIAEAHFDNPGQFAALVAELVSDGVLDENNQEAEKLTFVFEMYDAVDRFFAIVAATYPHKATQGWKTIADLAKVPVDDGTGENWRSYIFQSFSYSPYKLPADVPGAGDTSFARVLTYARRLFERFGGLNPQNRFSSTLAANTGGDAALQAVAGFLGATPKFDLESTNVDRWLTENPPTTPLSPSAISKLKQVQRVYRVTPSFTAASALIQDGLDSAVKVAQYSEGDFIARYAERVGGLSAARDIHRVASHYSSEVLFTLVKFHQNLTDTGGLTALPGPVNFRVLSPLEPLVSYDSTDGTTQKFPNWVTLFGGVGQCACKQCQTVLSPGAYMVDLLRFIDGAPKKTLFLRRPDLADIEITCPNTDKALPYIDLVNEVLESVVAPLSFALPGSFTQSSFANAVAGDSTTLAQLRLAWQTAGFPLTDHFVVKVSAASQKPPTPTIREWVLEDDAWRFTIRGAAPPFTVSPSPQTSVTNDALEVFPEHFNPAAYALLASAVFPFNLPLSLGREEVSIFLRAKNAPQHEILESFTTADFLTTLATEQDALAYLHLSADEASALLGTTPGKQAWDYWGLSNASDVKVPRPDQPTVDITFHTDAQLPAWVKALSLVPVFLHRTGLTYQQLLDLLDTEFVHVDTGSSHGVHVIASAVTTDLIDCNYNNFQLAHLNLPTLERISFFVRLWRKLGWSMREVDRYLVSLEGAQIPNNLVMLAQVKRLTDELKQKPLVVISWWSKLDTRRTPRTTKSLFDELFLVGAPNQPEVESLERIAQGESIGIDPSEVAEVEALRAHVRAALRVNARDMELLWEIYVASGTTLGIEELSALHRAATFAQALRLSAEGLLDVVALVGTSPFTDGLADPSLIPAAVGKTFSALREIRRWQSTRMSAAELSYLLTHQSEAGDSFVPSEEAFDKAAQSLATAATELSNAVPDVAAPDQAVLTAQLSKVMPADKIVKALDYLASSTSFAVGSEQRKFLERYFAPFLPANANAFFTALEATLPPVPPAAARYLTVWGRSPLHRDANLAPALFSYLFEQARSTAAFSTAAELVGLDRDATDRLLTDVLHSVADTALPPTVFAVEDWKAFLAGGWNTGESVLQGAGPGARSSLLLVPRAGDYRFVASIASPTATQAELSLSIDGVPLALDAVDAVKHFTGHTEIVYAPQTLTAASIVDIAFAFTGSTTVTLSWRIDNADAVLIPQGALMPFKRDAYLKLFKAARIVKGLKLGRTDLQYLVEAANIDFDLDRLPLQTAGTPAPWADFAAVIDLLALKRSISLKNQTLFEFWLDGAGDASLEDVAELTGWKAEDIATIQGLFGAPPTFADSALWLVLERAMRVTRRLDLRAAQILELLVAQPPTPAVAATLRNAFRAQFGRDTWKEVFKPLRDPLRQRQRDALVGYLTTRPVAFAGNSAATFIDANDLYAALLIDTQMEPDTLISRIKLALNVIQLFVDRVFLGLEDQSSLIELNQAKEQWVWMGRYRVWEANRKVFLYPENWIEPELRDDKTELFSELEDELLEGEATHDHGMQVLTSYLDKMGEVSNLEVVGAFSQTVNSGGTSFVLHVVGRTRSQSRGFFYRTFVGKQFHDGNWTPWRKISLDINADSVAPIVYQGRLHLIWPNLQTKQKPRPYPDKTKGETSGTVTGENLAAPNRTDFVTEVRLMWSDYNPLSKKWSKPRLSKSRALDTDAVAPPDRDMGQDQPPTDPYHLRVEASSSEHVSVSVIRAQVPAQSAYLTPKSLGQFKLWFTGDDTFEPYVQTLTLNANYPIGTVLKHNGAEEVSFLVNNWPAQDELRFGSGRVFFFKTPDVYRIVPTNFGFIGTPEYKPFFYETTRTSLFGINKGLINYPSMGNEKVQTASFSTFNHPLILDFQQQLHSYGPEGIMNRLTQALPVADNRYYNNYYYNYYGYLYLGYHIAGDNQAWWTTQRMFEADYAPELTSVFTPYPLPTVEFGYGTTFGAYNWELFFHLPMLVAGKLSQNLKFEDAMRWYHFVFDPRRDLEVYEQTKRFVDALPDGARYWNFLPFFANKDATDSLAETLGLKKNLSTYEQQQLTSLIDEWRNNPFKPHLIARQRISAYQKNVVMKYLDNLIAWADSLFRQDTFETINQATQLYVLADELLGARPQVIEPLTGEPKYTYRELAARGIDEFSNAIVEAENLLTSNRGFAKETTLSPLSNAMAPIGNLTVQTFYFAIPRNERLDKYWDTVADRLFKIRNSMNIDGVKRQLALFEPPIDPALLVKAAAAGLDLSSVLAQLNAPLPCYRFNVWVQKATELCNETKSFGAAFLAALEKKDGEALQLLRQGHELKMLELVRKVREQQVAEAEENIEALRKSQELAALRSAEYQKRITEDRTGTEKSQIDQTESATFFEELQGAAHTLSALFGLIPDATGGVVGIMPIGEAEFKIGSALYHGSEAAASVLGVIASMHRGKAAVAGLNAGFDRRKEDWNLQKSLADLEVLQLKQQIVVAEIRKDIATQELANHETQIAQSEEMQTFLQDKFTNRELYEWMLSELRRTYQKVYKLAFDVAKTAERSFQFELGIDDTFIQYGYVDSLRQGLLAGERLMYDLKRLDVAYLERNKRELEIQKSISLAALNGEALQRFRETGVCELSLPEILFDLDFPGHYFRRIKAARLTIPCVTGPYTSVSAKLTLIGSAMRKDSVADDYPYRGFEDPRFVHDLVGIQSIATSTAQNDAGLFELNFRDERYLPFEGAGAISRWRLELPTAARQFDYHSISDVVLHLSYTARDAGGTLRKGAEETIENGLNRVLQLVANEATPTGLLRTISLREEFPDVLHALLTSSNTPVALNLRPEHFPFLLRNARATLSLAGASPFTVRAHAIVKAGADPSDLPAGAMFSLTPEGSVPPTTPDKPFLGASDVLVAEGSTTSGGLVPAGAPTIWTLKQSGLDPELVEDLVLLVNYTFTLPN
jgi:hypothetical protein